MRTIQADCLRMADVARAVLIRQATGGGHRDGAAARVGSTSKFSRKKAYRHRNRRLYRDREYCDDLVVDEYEAPGCYVLLCAAEK